MRGESTLDRKSVQTWDNNPATVRRDGWGTLLCMTLVFAAACLMLFADLGKFPLFNPDEALYAEPAREMLDTGQYVTTLLNYVVRYTKPPLVIWGMALSYKIFGADEFAARFLGAACGAVLVACTYLFVERYCSRKAGLIAAFALITSPLYIGTAREAITDMPLSLFMAGSMMAFFHGYTQKAGFWRWIGYILTGLAVMTKGPVGVVLPVGILGCYHVLRGDLLQAWRYYKPLPGLLVVAAIAVPWFAVEIYQTKGAYYNEFLVRENFQRFTSVVDHKAPWWYHIAAVAGGMLPWSLFLPQSLLSAIRAPKPVLYGAFGHLSDRQALPLFSACWFLITLAFFSISVSKLLPYTVPAFPAAAALIAVYIEQALDRNRRKPLAVPLCLLVIIFTAGAWVAPIVVAKVKEAPSDVAGLAQAALITLGLGTAISLLALLKKRGGLAITAFTGVVFCALLGFGLQGMQIASTQLEGPIPAFSQYAAVSSWPIVVYHMRKPSVPFYAHRQVVIPHNSEEFEQKLATTNGAYILGKKADETYIASMPRCRVIARQGLYVLVCQQPTGFSH